MFRDWLLAEETHKDHIKKIDVFDFDDTLVRTPTPEQAAELLKKHNIQAALDGKECMRPIDGHCYWYSYQSLQPPILPQPCPCKLLNQGIAQSFYGSARDPQKLTVILTGRPPHLEKHVQRILDDFKLKPNRLKMVPVASSTLPKKLEIIADLFDEFPHVGDFEMWDDRGPLKSQLADDPNENHIAEFRKFLSLLNNVRKVPFKFKVNEVPPPTEFSAKLLRQFASRIGEERKVRAKAKREKKKSKKSD